MEILGANQSETNPAETHSVIDRQNAIDRLAQIVERSFSTEILKYDEPESFGRPRYSKEVITILAILGEKIDENIPLRGEPDALKKLAQISAKYSRH